MSVLLAFCKKEWMEAARTGRLFILLLLFTLFGIMSPAIAKLLPWMMELFADTMAESGLIITEMKVDAMTSWTQFFKNISIAFIAFLLLHSDLFVKEYQSGTLLLMLTKGLPRSKAVLAKFALLLALWTLCYFLCFAITYGYNACFWDNSIAENLVFAVMLWWLFGVWLLCLLVLFSACLQNGTGVAACIGGSVLLVYFISLVPKIKPYTPMALLDTAPLLTGAKAAGQYGNPLLVTLIFSALCIMVSFSVIQRRDI